MAVKNKNCNSFQYFTFLQEEEDFEDLLASVEDLQDYEEVGEEVGEEALMMKKKSNNNSIWTCH